MIQTEEHRIANLPQGIMMVGEPDKRLYLRAGLSECSVLAARSQDGRVFAAHASYSELREVEAVVAYLAEQGIAAEDIRVVAATNQPSTEIFVSDVTKPATLEDYARLGILPEHIRSFNYNLESGLEAADWTSYNLAQVLVTPDYVFTYNFDEIDTPSYGRQKRSAYRNEEILSLVD